MRKPTFCLCENKDADQRRGYREADQRLCFRYIDSTNGLYSVKYYKNIFIYLSHRGDGHRMNIRHILCCDYIKNYSRPIGFLYFYRPININLSAD